MEYEDIPTGYFSEAFNRLSLSFGALEEIEGSVAEDGHDMRGVLLSNSGIILIKRHIKRPVKGVFDCPVAANGLQGFLRGWCYERRNINNGFLPIPFPLFPFLILLE